jgi:hypothetical protein
MGWLGGGGGGGGAAATYSLSAGTVTSVDEGKSVTITLTTTNVGTADVAYTISGVSLSDFSIRGGFLGGAQGFLGNNISTIPYTPTALTGNFKVINNSASITFGISTDFTTEGSETFTIGIDGQTASVSVTINDISTSSYTVLKNGSRACGYAGPGGVYDAYGALMPLKGRALGIINNSGKDMFIPTKTQAEMTALYNNLNISGVTVLKGDYISEGRLWKNQVAYTGGPCYNYPYLTYDTDYIDLGETAPAAVDSGFLDGGIVRGWATPLYFSGSTGGAVRADDIGWLFYMTTTWGCAVSGYPWIFANVRYGYAEF